MWGGEVPNNTTSLGIGLVLLAMLAYGVAVLLQGFINGEKRRVFRSRPPFTVSRWRNPGAYWFYTAADVVTCLILAAFAFYFLRGLF
jgi:hypothetical protein